MRSLGDLAGGALGSAMSEVLAEHLPASLSRIGLRDTFGISENPEHLLKHYGLTAADVAAAARQLLARKFPVPFWINAADQPRLQAQII